MSEMQSVKDIITAKKIQPISTVNSSTVNGSNNNSLNTSTVNSMDTSQIVVKTRQSGGNSFVYEKLKSTLDNIPLEVDYIAEMFASELDDIKSINYYKILAREHDHIILFEALSSTKKAVVSGNLRLKKAQYFLGILRKKGLQTRFSDNNAV